MSPSSSTGGRVVGGQPQEVVAVIRALLPCHRSAGEEGQPQEVVAVIAILLSSSGLFIGYVSW